MAFPKSAVALLASPCLFFSLRRCAIWRTTWSICSWYLQVECNKAQEMGTQRIYSHKVHLASPPTARTSACMRGARSHSYTPAHMHAHTHTLMRSQAREQYTVARNCTGSLEIVPPCTYPVIHRSARSLYPAVYSGESVDHGSFTCTHRPQSNFKVQNCKL